MHAHTPRTHTHAHTPMHTHPRTEPLSPQSKDKPLTNGHHTEPVKFPTRTEPKSPSTTEPKPHSNDPAKSKLSKLGKSLTHSGSKDSKLQAPSAHTKERSQEEVKSPKTTEVRSKTLPHPSKLHGPKKDEEAPVKSDEDLTRPQSRLKFPGSGRGTPNLSGRSTPTMMGRSGLARPSSRLSKEDGGGECGCDDV